MTAPSPGTSSVSIRPPSVTDAISGLLLEYSASAVTSRREPSLNRAVTAICRLNDLRRRQPVGRRHDQPDDLGIGVRAEGGPLPNPAEQRLVIAGANAQPFAAAVSHRAGGLVQEYARLRGRQEKAPPARLARQGVEIDPRLKAQQRQAETVLASRFAVTGAAVASELAEDRRNLVREIDRLFSLGILDGHGHFHGFALELGKDIRGPILRRRKQSVGVDLCDLGIDDADSFDLPGQVANPAVGVMTGDDELLQLPGSRAPRSLSGSADRRAQFALADEAESFPGRRHWHINAPRTEQGKPARGQLFDRAFHLRYSSTETRSWHDGAWHDAERRTTLAQSRQRTSAHAELAAFDTG